jgi:hypothetical protein
MSTHSISFDLEPTGTLASVTTETTISSGQKWTDVDGNPSEAFHREQYLGCTQYRDWFVSECGPVTARITGATELEAPAHLN